MSELEPVTLRTTQVWYQRYNRMSLDIITLVSQTTLQERVYVLYIIRDSVTRTRTKVLKERHDNVSLYNMLKRE